MQLFRLLFLTFLAATINLHAYGQDSDFENQFSEAESFIQSKNFNKAIDLLLKIEKTHPENANIQFKLGFCYLQTSYQKSKAIKHLKKASKNTEKKYYPDNPKIKTAPYETSFFLAKAYYHNHNFKKANSLFRKFKAEIKDKANANYLAKLDKHIKINQNASEIKSKAIDVNIIHLPKGINTEAIEYAPVVSGDEQMMIFTSNRQSNEPTDLSHSDNLFQVKKENETWGEVQNLENINTSEHQASTSLSFDGNNLVIYINDDGDGSLYQSSWLGDHWSQPQKLPDPINSPHLETHGCYSPDKTEFFFTSDRPEGYGGLDIYMTRKLPTGIWSAATNLGPNINTPENEDSPFMHPDNQKLYFSSAGHKTMGGLDIFVAERKDVTEWSAPKNVGYPINNTADDVCFSVSADGKRGYYASYNESSYGETDLYMIQMPGEDHTNLLVYVGYAKNSKGKILKNAEITAYDKANGEMFGVYTPNPRTGKFVLAAEEGKKLKITIEADGYKTIEKNIEIKKPPKDIEENIKEIPMEDIRMQNLWRIPDYIFMPYDAYETKIDEKFELVELMQEKPDVRLKLIGYTDSKGSETYNQKLSKKRAAYVKKYFVNQGIASNRIIIQGKGEKEPIAVNDIDGKDCPKGRAYNRRVEILLIGAHSETYTIDTTNIPPQLQHKDQASKKTL